MTSTTYEFDAGFQKKIVAMLMRDEVFLQRVEGLVDPVYLDEDANAWLVDLTNRHFKTYRQVPSGTIVLNEIRTAKSAGAIKEEFVDELKEVLKHVYGKPDLSNRDYMAEQVAKFARERAIEEALIKSADIVEKKGDFEKIRKMLSSALDVGQQDGLGAIDVCADIEDRVNRRVAALSATRLPTGITTGYKDLDNALYHGGWGRKELSLLMGGPKSGKSIGLQDFAVNAQREGYNVLFCTLENSKDVTADRMDANICDIAVKDLGTNPTKVTSSLKAFAAKAGILKIHEFATKTFKCSDLRRLIRRYQSQSILFDLIVVDYADIMLPEERYDEERRGLTEIYGGLRAIAQQENVAMLSATQTNRAGAKASTATKTDVAEDINKTRLADILISINADVDEKARNEMRLYFAASRNSEDEFGFRCKTNRSHMRFITKIIDRF